jgi:nitrite reductase/ring-hydroxylating ferredoxin subunit
MAFVTVGKAEDAPPEGELARFELNGTAIAVANVGGGLHGIADACTHAQCSLSEGDLNGTHVVCACHVGTFDVLTGEVVAAPPRIPAPVYAVRIEGDDLQVEM